MSQIRRDIVITLTLKLSLLIVLWFVCFKGTHATIDIEQQWSIGKNSESTATSPSIQSGMSDNMDFNNDRHPTDLESVNIAVDNNLFIMAVETGENDVQMS